MYINHKTFAKHSWFKKSTMKNIVIKNNYYIHLKVFRKLGKEIILQYNIFFKNIDLA